MISDLALKRRVNKCLRQQGYVVERGNIALCANDKVAYKKVHEYSRFMKVKKQIDFLERNRELSFKHVVDSEDIEVRKIQPKLIEVKAGTKWDTLFKWWCLVWWSIPHDRPIGRQMRFILWDEHHESIIGLIGLQSPILSWAPRDTYLAIGKDEKEVWVNQSMNAQRVGALPPYNDILGGKLVASILVSKEIRLAFQKKYRNRKTLMEGRILPNRLLFITTTGAFGKSPIYDRLSYGRQKLSFFLGYTQGFGSFHISDDIYRHMLEYLSLKKVNIQRGYGSGPSRKMKLIRTVMQDLGFSQGTKHTVRRGIYLFTPIQNLKEVVAQNRRPKYSNFSVKELTDFWKERWILPRLKDRTKDRTFKAEEYIMEELEKIRAYGERDNKKLRRTARRTDC